MITITAAAIEKIKELSESEGIDHLKIRAKIIGGGCSGFKYDMIFEESESDLDEKIEQDNVTVLIDPVSLQYLEGATIDYSEGLMSSGFKFINPNVKSSCGCNSSFNI